MHVIQSNFGWGEVNINTLMDQLEQENQTHQQGVVRRHDNTIVNMVWNIEANIILEGDELSKSEQTLLETYLGNLIGYKNKRMF
jgi:hypothetical protein